MGPLRLGVIGVSRRWTDALGTSPEVAVVAAHDPALARAVAAAEAFRAAVCEGVVELLERDDVEAVLLGPAWFGTWPLAHAAARQKPVLCTVALTEDAPGAVWPAECPARWRGGRALRQVAAGLGPARFFQASAPGDGAGWLTLAADLFRAEPAAARGVRAGDVAAWLVDFGGGRSAQLTLGAARAVMTVEAEGGWARLELPGLLEWEDAAGRHTRRLAGGAAGEVLRAFAAAVRAGEAMEEAPRLRRAGAVLAGAVT
ncbi:MAG: hypothetical protein ACRC33_22940 [Gemmataceae bacterium]